MRRTIQKSKIIQTKGVRTRKAVKPKQSRIIVVDNGRKRRTNTYRRFY